MKITSQNLYQIGELPTDQLREAILLLAMEVSKEERRLSLKRNRTQKWRERHGDARGHGDAQRHGDACNLLKLNGERHGDTQNEIRDIYNNSSYRKDRGEEERKKGRVWEGKKEGRRGERKDAEFEEFWQVYPRKVAKQKAYLAYCKARRQGASREEILSGASIYAACQTDAAFIAHAATWLNGKRWQDTPSHIAPVPSIKPLTFREAGIIGNRRMFRELIDAEATAASLEAPLGRVPAQLVSPNGNANPSGNGKGHVGDYGGLFGKGSG